MYLFNIPIDIVPLRQKCHSRGIETISLLLCPLSRTISNKIHFIKLTSQFKNHLVLHYELRTGVSLCEKGMEIFALALISVGDKTHEYLPKIPVHFDLLSIFPQTRQFIYDCNSCVVFY